MSLPQFDVQGSLFESLEAITPELFVDNVKMRPYIRLSLYPPIFESSYHYRACPLRSERLPAGQRQTIVVGQYHNLFATMVPRTTKGCV